MRPTSVWPMWAYGVWSPSLTGPFNGDTEPCEGKVTSSFITPWGILEEYRFWSSLLVRVSIGGGACGRGVVCLWEGVPKGGVCACGCGMPMGRVCGEGVCIWEGVPMGVMCLGRVCVVRVVPMGGVKWWVSEYLPVLNPTHLPHTHRKRSGAGLHLSALLCQGHLSSQRPQEKHIPHWCSVYHRRTGDHSGATMSVVLYMWVGDDSTHQLYPHNTHIWCIHVHICMCTHTYVHAHFK